MLQAFIDDSGTHKRDRYFVLAGFVAPAEEWARFADEWRKVLDEAPRLEYFKMSEADSLTKQFAGWTRERMEQRMNALADVIPRHVGLRVHCAISHRVYETKLKGKQFRSIDTPYFVCFYGIMKAIIRAVRHEGPLSFIFDQQQAVGRRMRILWPLFKEFVREDAARWLGTEPIFADDKKLLPLQAADLYAFHVRRYMRWNESLIVPENVIVRRLASIPSSGDVVTAESLEEAQRRVEASGLVDAAIQEIERFKALRRAGKHKGKPS